METFQKELQPFIEEESQAYVTFLQFGGTTGRAVDTDEWLRLSASPEDNWDKKTLWRGTPRLLIAEGFIPDDLISRDCQLPGDWKLEEDIPESSARRIIYALTGGLGENFVERFKLVAVKIGEGLGADPTAGPDIALETCFSYVFHDVREYNSELLRMATPDGGGLIPHVTEALATVCLRLAQCPCAVTQATAIVPVFAKGLGAEAEEGDQAATAVEGIAGKPIEWQAYYAKLQAEYVHQEFPKWKYHPDLPDGKIVETHAELKFGRGLVRLTGRGRDGEDCGRSGRTEGTTGG